MTTTAVYYIRTIPYYWVVRDEAQMWLVPATDGGWTRRRPYHGDTAGLQEVPTWMAAGVGIPVGDTEPTPDAMLHCQRCGHTWQRRSPTRPTQCPRCTSRVWDKPKSYKSHHKESTMTTKLDIIREPERLGDGVTDEDVQLFVSAVEVLERQGVTESDAIDQVWGNGDWVPRATRLVG